MTTSASPSRAVRTSTWRSAPARRRRRQTSMPSGPGPSARSRMSRSNGRSASASRAARPSGASTTRCPSASSAPAISAPSSASSSTRSRSPTSGGAAAAAASWSVRTRATLRRAARAHAASPSAATAAQRKPNTGRKDREPALCAGLSARAHAARMPAADRLRSLTVVLPCHDEEDNVATAIRDAGDAAQRAALDHEIVVVDDGSADATGRVAAAAAQDDPRVRVVVHEQNRGYGAALRSGIAAARCDWILLPDAALQFALLELARFVAPARTHDLVVGYRLVRMDPLMRRFNAYAWNRLVGRVFDLDVRDVDCAFKLIRRDLAQRLVLTADGAMISTELVARAALAGASVAPLGVRHRPRVAGRQSGAEPAVGLGALRELRRIRAPLRGAPARPHSASEPPQPAAA